MLRTVLAILTPRERLTGLLVILLIGLMAIIELGGIGIIFWFMKIVVEPDLLDQYGFLRWAYQAFGFTELTDFRFWLGVAVVGFIAFRNLFAALTLWVEVRFSNRLVASLASRLLRAYLSRPYAYFLRNNAGDLTRNIAEEIPKLVSGFVFPAFRIGTDGMIAMAIIVMLAAYDLGMTILIAIAGVFFGGAYVLIRGVLGNLGSRRIGLYHDRFKTANEALSGIKEIKVQNVERHFQDTFSRQANELARLDSIAHFIKQSPRFFLELLGFSALMGLALYTLATSNNAQETIGVLTLYGVAGIRLMPAVNKVLEGFSNVRYNGALMVMLSKELLAVGRLPEAARGRPLRLETGIVFDDVRFRYEQQDDDVLKGINIRIARNTAIGLVGPTGSGKTTLIDIVMGLLQPTGGRMLVDGRELTEAELSGWQSAIGYVPQQIYLLDRSIKENIALGLPDAEIDMAAVRHAARLAHIDDFIESELPEGYETVVGDRGVRLSGGQRQRIGIARALYHQPSILVLDEATAALDNITESEIAEAIGELGASTTIITIAHRLSTVRKCDRIFVMHEGRVTAEGGFDELAKHDSTFQQLTARQAV